MDEFFNFFFPILDACGATKADVCSCCGQPFDGTESWLLVNDAPVKLHRACRERIESDTRREEAAAKENDTGNYGMGLLGAFLGSGARRDRLGADILLGRVSVVGGLIIALFAVKGYDILHGRQGKGKIAIVLIMSLLGVVLGTFGGEMIALIKEIAAGTLPGITYGDAPVLVLALLANEPEYQSGCAEQSRHGRSVRGGWNLFHPEENPQKPQGPGNKGTAVIIRTWKSGAVTARDSFAFIHLKGN